MIFFLEKNPYSIGGHFDEHEKRAEALRKTGKDEPIAGLAAGRSLRRLSLSLVDPFWVIYQSDAFPYPFPFLRCFFFQDHSIHFSFCSIVVVFSFFKLWDEF